RLVGADDVDVACLVGRRFRTNVPQVNLEVGRAEKAEVVGLIDVFVRAAGHADVGDGQVAHGRAQVRSELVVAEQFAQPAAGVVEFLEGNPLHAVDSSRVEGHTWSLRS